MCKSYELLLKKANELKPKGFLKLYENDLLVVDRGVLRSIPATTPFLWAIQPQGTFLLTRTQFIQDQSKDWRSFCERRIQRILNPDSGYKSFHYDGFLLEELVNISQAESIFQKWSIEKNG